MVLVVVVLHGFEGRERPLHRVTHAFGRAPADVEFLLYVVERHAAAQTLHPDRQLDDVHQTFVAHRIPLGPS